MNETTKKKHTYYYQFHNMSGLDTNSDNVQLTKFITEIVNPTGEKYNSYVIAEDEEKALKIIFERNLGEKIVNSYLHFPLKTFSIKKPASEILVENGFKHIKTTKIRVPSNGQDILEDIVRFEGTEEDLHKVYELLKEKSFKVSEMKRVKVTPSPTHTAHSFVNEIVIQDGFQIHAIKVEETEQNQSINILEQVGLSKEDQSKALKIGLLTMQMHNLNEKHRTEAEERDKMWLTRDNLITELLKQK